MSKSGQKRADTLTAQMSEFAAKMQEIKDGDYKATAIKIELEAELGRPDTDETEYCNTCDGDGNVMCSSCEGDGGEEVTGEEDEEWVDCEDCTGSGRQECEECEGRGEVDSDDGWSESYCEDWLKDYVTPQAHDALVFSRFYNDGSVDSEFTFTLMIDDAKYAIEFIKAFKALSEAIGNGLDVSGAGMHIAVLNDPRGYYQNYGNTRNHLNSAKTENFVQAMTPLLPALYFLGSADHRSRELGYRKPWISSPWHHDGDKYSAINGGAECFEFRVFETCYDRPEALFDYLIVIANCLKFYSSKKTNTFLGLGTLGMKRGQGLTRLYYTENHLKALEAGLRHLKPAYKSIQALKAERHFPYSLTDFKGFAKKQQEEWRKEYGEVKRRQIYERRRRYHAYLADYYRRVAQYGEEAIRNEYSGTAREWALSEVRSNYKQLYGGVREYVKYRKTALEQEGVDYTITV